MKVLLIDADGKDFPNLALMKLSGYYKDKGDQVFFGSAINPDIVYISCVFTWNRESGISASTYYPDSEIHFGGSGFNSSAELPYEIEHHKPDYSLYGIDYSMGFTTRGCIRNCGFCIVPKKEGIIRKHSPLEEFIEPNFDKVMILDNNLLAYKSHKNILSRLIEFDKKTCFNQGLDIRLINEENADLLSQLKYYDQRFKSRRLYFAWDLPEIEKEVIRGIKTLFDFGVRPDHLMFFVLMCYNTNYEQDIRRLQTLINLGVKPYVMLYNNIKGTYQHHMKRWIEWRYYEMNIPWEKYDHGDSQIHINHQMSYITTHSEKEGSIDP